MIIKKFCTLALLIFIFLPFVSAQEETLYDLKGKEIGYQEFAASSKAVLFFWTSWCPYCRRQLREFNKNCSGYPQISFFYINLGERNSTVERLVANLGLKECIRSKILLDKEGFFADKFFIISMPTYIFLKNGEFVYRADSINEKVLKKAFKDE